MNPFQAELDRRRAGNPFEAELARRGVPAVPQAIGRYSPTGGENVPMGDYVSDPERQARGATLAQLRAAEEGRGDMPSQEQMAPVAERTVDAAIGGAVQGLAPTAGALAGRGLQMIPRSLARGVRTRGATQVAIDAVAKPATTSPVKALVEELSKVAATTAVAGGTGTLAAGPLGPISGAGGALLSVLGSMQPRMAAVLAGNPGFREWAMRAAAEPWGLGAQLATLTAAVPTAGLELN